MPREQQQTPHSARGTQPKANAGSGLTVSPRRGGRKRTAANDSDASTDSEEEHSEPEKDLAVPIRTASASAATPDSGAGTASGRLTVECLCRRPTSSDGATDRVTCSSGVMCGGHFHLSCFGFDVSNHQHDLANNSICPMCVVHLHTNPRSGESAAQKIHTLLSAHPQGVGALYDLPVAHHFLIGQSKLLQQLDSMLQSEPVMDSQQFLTAERLAEVASIQQVLSVQNAEELRKAVAVSNCIFLRSRSVQEHLK